MAEEKQTSTTTEAVVIPMNDSAEEQKKKHNDLVDSVLNNIKDNKFKIYVYSPTLNAPSGGMFTLFKHVNILKNEGYDVSILYEPKEDSKASYEASLKTKKKTSIYEPFEPVWMGDLLKDVNMICLGEGEILFNNKTKIQAAPLTVNAEDILVIPEGFPNMMEKTAQLPCKRIVLAQSWYYILNALPVGQKWQHYGINDVISVSDGITQYLNAVMTGLNVKNYSQSIDRNIFKRVPFSKKLPKIAYMPGRSQDSHIKSINVIKTFYSFYPQYRWIRFDELRGLTREEYAERLGESSIALYTDEIAGFGTMPLEAMACGTHVVGWNPLGSREFIKETNGFWAQNGDVFQLAELLGFAVEKMVSGELDAPDVLEEYEKTLERYTAEKEKESIQTIYNQFKNERIEQLTHLKQ